MAAKRKRGSTWHYTVKRAKLLGRPREFTFADEGEGDEWIARLESLLDRGIIPDELKPAAKGSPRLRERVREYRGAQHLSASDGNYLAIAVERLPAGLELRDLTFTWATEWVTRMKREDNLAPSSIRHHAGALARCLDWMAGHGQIPFNPLRLLPRGYAVYTPEDVRILAESGGAEKFSTERDRRLEEGEEAAIRAILAGAKPEGRQRALKLPHAEALRMLFDLALESAMRMREMYTLSKVQIDLPRRTVFLDRTKNGDKRQVPLSSVALERLAAYLHAVKGSRAFPWWNGSANAKTLADTTTLLSRQFARIFDAAGCKDLHFHDLRHEATSRLFERTQLSDVQVAKITGHKSPRMLARYANLRASDLAMQLW